MHACAGFNKRPDTGPPGAITRSRSGVGTDMKAVSPSPSKSNVGLKPHASPSRSVSDSGEGFYLLSVCIYVCICVVNVMYACSYPMQLQPRRKHIGNLLQKLVALLVLLFGR